MFIDLYPMNVLEYIKKGETVYVTDRKLGENYDCTTMLVYHLVDILQNAANDKENRYQFYLYDKNAKNKEYTA